MNRVLATEPTLLVLPCSGSKSKPRVSKAGASILGDLSVETARRLVAAREALSTRTQLNESVLVPALERYRGFLYQEAGTQLSDAVNRGLHVLIISGGYGVLRATEPIGDYNEVFHLAWWPPNLIQTCLIEYCARHSLTAVRALVSVNGDYAKVIQRTDWSRAGIHDALMLSPDLRGQGGAMRKGPTTIGEAIVALLERGIPQDWASSTGNRMVVTDLSHHR